MINLKWDESLIGNFESIEKKYETKLKAIQKELLEKKCLGNDFLDWLDWPSQKFFDKDYGLMQSKYEEWQQLKIDTIVVIGIGGSYIGPKAGLDMLTYPFDKNKINVVFASGLHTIYTKSLINSLKDKNWAIIVVSKSGTTFETAVNFRIYREALMQQYGLNHANRIVAVTDENKGVLNSIATNHNYMMLTIPDGIGGRYSSLTPVGLFVMKMAGIDIDGVLNGWRRTMDTFKNSIEIIHDAQIYAAIRHQLLMEDNKVVEVFNTYENNLRFIGEHYKQIFAESEGKTPKCLIPTLANHSEDLHSIGQLYQQGNQQFFETTLTCRAFQTNYEIMPSSFNNDDQLDYLVGQPLKQLNEWIELAVKKAHKHVPNITIEITDCDAKNFGMLMAWIAIAAASSALLLEVNPFDQPGVEDYKAEMKKLIK